MLTIVTNYYENKNNLVEGIVATPVHFHFYPSPLLLTDSLLRILNAFTLAFHCKHLPSSPSVNISTFAEIV